MCDTHITLVIFSPVLSMVIFCLVVTYVVAHVTIKLTRMSETFIANITVMVVYHQYEYLSVS